MQKHASFNFALYHCNLGFNPLKNLTLHSFYIILGKKNKQTLYIYTYNIYSYIYNYI